MTKEENLNSTCDKTKLPPGPWQDEPDRKDFEHAGLPCFALRGPMGAWCGYVGVPEGHPLFGVSYDEVDEKVNVHGGLTYSGRCHPPICHIAKEGEPERWWFGFDCAHAGDLTPDLPPVCLSPNDVYRDLAYIENACRSLATQLVCEGARLRREQEKLESEILLKHLREAMAAAVNSDRIEDVRGANSYVLGYLQAAANMSIEENREWELRVKERGK